MTETVFTAFPLNPAQMTRVASQGEWTTGTSCSAMSLADACWCSPAVTDSSFKGQSKSRAPTKDGTRSPRFVKVSHLTVFEWRDRQSCSVQI